MRKVGENRILCSCVHIVKGTMMIIGKGFGLIQCKLLVRYSNTVVGQHSEQLAHKSLSVVAIETKIFVFSFDMKIGNPNLVTFF